MAQPEHAPPSSTSGCDELSIDSRTNEKVLKDLAPRRQPPPPMFKEPAHFRIDWRQLTYYRRPGMMQRWPCVGAGAGANKTRPDAGRGAKGAPSLKRILNSLDGSFKSGQLSAILGPSGAGKSTFIDTLFGSKQEGAYGETRVTWLGAQTNERRHMRIASLPQQDHLLHHLTVYETLLFASRIKNPRRNGQRKNFHQLNVRRVAKMLKLTECLDTRCSKLSGGQYKRVSIGQELLSEPDVIILDEPTSGLDAMTCLTTVQTLKSIVTKHAISIILTIHQPDSDVFDLFDHVYVIAQGGVAIYEGPPSGIAGRLAAVGLQIPSASYNPARFIVEHAFLDADLECAATSASADDCDQLQASDREFDDDDDCDTSDDEEEDESENKLKGSNYLTRSVISLTDALAGREMSSQMGRKRDRKPLLNIGIQTLDGKLITSKDLRARDRRMADEKRLSEKRDLIKRLNALQQAPYRGAGQLSDMAMGGCTRGKVASMVTTSTSASASETGDASSGTWSARKSTPTLAVESSSGLGGVGKLSPMAKAQSTSEMCALRAEPLLSRALWSRSARDQRSQPAQGLSMQPMGRAASRAASNYQSLPDGLEADEESGSASTEVEMESEFRNEDSSTSGSATDHSSWTSESGLPDAPRAVLATKRRRFDKRLSARHSMSRFSDYPIWRHSFIIMHRTWLSIVRDPIFFGIQAMLHTIIPLLLAFLFGTLQEEGCPELGNFDLVEFAYSNSSNLIDHMVDSIRGPIGNIGMIFFEMFVLSFSINCITALVFPQDMHVLLREYRNGWYSMRSYFLGRTLADLPVPILLHALGLSLLYYLSGQPRILWRYSAILFIVIIASLISQSVGLTVGAVLMRSPQSAVLAAAGLVAPFFAVSGFIARVHTLPLVVQAISKVSYLHYLLNGFIILRYGYGLCDCSPEDFERGNEHQVPSNLATMASIWIGTYSNEFADSPVVKEISHQINSNHTKAATHLERTNLDPNIDIIQKLMGVLKSANSFGQQLDHCGQVQPYPMIDFKLQNEDIWHVVGVLLFMLLLARLMTFTAIYYKIRSLV